MQIVEISMTARSGRTTTLSNMLQGFKCHGFESYYMGFHDEALEFCKKYMRSYQSATDFANLHRNNIRTGISLFIDDFELNSKKWAKAFPDAPSLQEKLEAYESTGTAFIFTEKREDDLASTERHVNEVLAQIDSLDFSSRELNRYMTGIENTYSNAELCHVLKMLLTDRLTQRKIDTNPLQNVISCNVDLPLEPYVLEEVKRQLELLKASRSQLGFCCY
jgi:hypothetical protein